ncbi:MAG: hypothetical protein CSA05_03690 [Bacteroidia bacterium]|nr:MAG: hypothetical protein CSA05_03690 [Bacteroidia bacterium]
MDTVVTQEDIALYVEEHSEKFILKSPLYQYYLAKIASKNKRDIRFVYKLFSKKNVNLMQNFNLASSTVISNNDTGWYTVQELRKALQMAVSEKRLLRLVERKPLVIGSKDKKYVYVLLPLKIIKVGQMTPKEYLSDRVREIILHNRKLALAKQLEYEIYEDAKKKDEFEVY